MKLISFLKSLIKTGKNNHEWEVPINEEINGSYCDAGDKKASIVFSGGTLNHGELNTVCLADDCAQGELS